MTEKPDWFYRQSAVIPYRVNGQDLEVVMITSRKRTRWVLPKGVVEPELTPQASAAQEALEEAGLIGRISEEAIGEYSYEKWGGTCRVEVFPFEVETVAADWPEATIRDREWVALSEAARRVDEPELSRLLLDLPRFLGR